MSTRPSAATSPPLSFASLMRMAPGMLGLAIVTAIVSAALSVAPFWFLYRAVAQLLLASPDPTVVRRELGWMLGLLVLRWGLMAASHVFAHIGAFAIQHRLRLRLARRLGEVPMSFFASRGSGSLRRTLSDDVNGLEGFYAHMLPDAVAAATVPLAALVLLFAADWRLALAALVPLPMAVLAQWLALRGTAARMREWSALQKRIADHVGEYVRGMQVVKTFGLSARSFGALANVVQGAADWVAGYARSSSIGWVLFTGLLTANLVVVAPLGAWLHLRGDLDLATWVLFLLVAPAVLAPLLRLTFALGEQMHRAEALARIDALLAAPVLAEPMHPALPYGKAELAFVDVCHRYHGRQRALDGVSFTAAAGRITALVGPSGSGKSTLARLPIRLYEYESGNVRVAGVDVRDWPLDALLARIAVVFQEVQLFHGSVRENLLIARPAAVEAEIVAATTAARAHDFISALPQGYDTPLGEHGARLSGGERQRLSIARALLKDAPILILDEATSYADTENEALIQQALAELCRNRTVLVIAHRLRTVMHADHIVVLDAGRIAGQGRHEILLRECALYRRLWQDHEQARTWTLEVRS